MISQLTIVIPQRNHGQMTWGCVQAVRRWERETCPIIVVDDGSQDGSAEMIEQAVLTNCELIRQESTGVTAAWNTGIRAVTTAWIVLLNNDVRIDGPFLEPLLRPISDRQAWIAGVEWRCEPLLPSPLEPSFPGRRLLAGWCFAFEAVLWSQLNGFDETLRLYFSDTDFQCRTATEATEDRAVLSAVPGLPLCHLGHQTARHERDRSAHWQSDRARFLKKWHSR